MTSELLLETPAVRCSTWTREQGVDPIGSATGCRELLLVEWPLPWPSDIGEIEPLAPLREATAGRGCRLQCIVPAAPGTARVALYRRSTSPGTPAYTGVAANVDPANVVAAAIALLGSDGGEPVDGAEVLVCTHGRRDRCCGSYGTALALELTAVPDVLGPGVRVERTSHTGGHRYAPTAIVLPQATMWAYVDTELLRRVVTGQGALDDVLPRYRGFCGHDRPEAQLLDRHAFAELGWSWLKHQRSSTVTPSDDGSSAIELTATAPDGSTSTWRGIAEPTSSVPVPVCGEPIEAARKTERQFRLIDAAHTS